MTIRPWIALIATVLTLTLASGCTNPFTPATPAPPIVGGLIESFSTPQNLLNTLELAIGTRGAAGQTAYYDAIADSTTATTFAFHAFHQQSVVDDWTKPGQTPPTIWDRRLELLFYSALADKLPTFTYSFAFTSDLLSGEDVTDLSAGLATLHRHYLLVATSADNSISSIVAVGAADLYMQRVGARWYLYRWEDRLDPAYGLHPTNGEYCMGRLRLDSTLGGL